MLSEKDQYFMTEALLEAQKAANRDEVPIGAVLVDSRTGEIMARASNATIEHSDPTSHAEILVIRDMCRQLGVQRLPEYDLYITLEPCPMCAAAISFARIRNLVFGASDPKSGGVLSGPSMYTHSQLHHKPDVRHGILSEDCGQILKDYFKTKRIAAGS